jgi:hypothetical protein
MFRKRHIRNYIDYVLGVSPDTLVEASCTLSPQSQNESIKLKNCDFFLRFNFSARTKISQNNTVDINCDGKVGHSIDTYVQQ